jgi:leader peptidase (prepilin peptidase)/N-methyltransferase
MALAPAAALAGLMGLVIGSFLNVVAYRLPRGESLAHPPSRCPGCGTPVKRRDNVPVLSWLLLGGKCRQCGTRISARYPLVEAGTAILAIAVVLVHGADSDVWLPLTLLALLVPIALIDLDERIIPNKIVVPGSVLALVIGAIVDPSGIPEQLIAGAGAFTFLLLALLAYPAGMGEGDVKLAGMMGLYLGYEVGVALLFGLLSGAIVGAVIIARKGMAEGRKTAVPFGPFLAFGGVVAMLAGEPIVNWYTHTFL